MRKRGRDGVPDKPWKKHVGILAYDLRGFGRRSSHERRLAQERLALYARECTPPGAIQLGWRPTGDGGFIFFDGPLGSNFDAVGLFREEMMDLDIDSLSDVRFALHDGHVTFNGSDYDGPGLILVSRLLDGMPRQPAGMTVMSGELAELLRDDRSGMSEHLIRLIDIPAKEGLLENWANVVRVEFETKKEQGLFSGSLGPRPWGFQHHEWNFNPDEVATFLENQPRYIPAGFAARAALRSVTVLARSVEINEENANAIFAPILYAMALPLVAGTWPTRGGEVEDAVPAAAHAVDAVYAGRTALVVLAAAHALDAITALDAAHAARAAAITALDAVDATLDAAHAAHAARATRTAARATLDAAHAARAAAITADMRAILATQGEPEKLKSWMSSPVWPIGSEPVGFSEDFSSLRSGLLALDPSWSVWFDWYDQRLRGAPADMEKELARATALTGEDYKQGAVHMNLKVMAAIASPESRLTPTGDVIDISAQEQKIVRREIPGTEVPSKPDLSDQEYFDALREELDPVIEQFAEPTQDNIVPQLREAVADFGQILSKANRPRIWFVQIEALRNKIAQYVDTDDPKDAHFRINGLLDTLRDDELELEDRFPAEAEVQRARRGQRQRPLTDEEKAALREVVESAIETLSSDLQERFGDLLDDETPVVSEEETRALRDQPLTVEQRSRLYEVKAYFLRVYRLVDQPREMLMKALGNAENAAQAADRFVRVAEKFREVWDRIASFLTSG